MKKIEVTLSSLTLCNPMHCRLAGSSVHGIFQARILEGITISFSKYCRPTAAYLLTVCVLTLTFQLCIRCIHMGTLSCQKESQPRWWVCGRSLEGSQRLSPRTSPPLPSQLSSGTIPGFTSITPESQCPDLAPNQVPGTQVSYGSQETRANTPASFRVPWPRLSPGSERFATKSLGWFSLHQDPWPLQLPEPCGSRELGTGWASRALLPSPHALHIWPRRRSSERMEGMSAALSAQPPLALPCTDEETTGP